MKSIFTLAAVLTAFAFASAKATSISMTISNPGNRAYALYLDGTPQVFDTVFVKITTFAPLTFRNQNDGLASGIPRPAGQAFSYYNRALDGASPTYLDWTVIDLVNTPSELSFAGGLLGAKIQTGGAPGLFLANVNLPFPGFGVATVRLYNGFDQVGNSLRLEFGPSEPASCVLAGVGILGLVTVRRRFLS